MKILSIETSCDDTGLALIETDNKNGIKIRANLVSSQIETHRPFGGVVPHLAKREHQKNLPLLFSKIHNSKFMIHDSDFIAVTQGPGLSPCLWTGINFAQELAKKFNKPLVGINHLKGHIYSALLTPKISKSKTLSPIKYPLLTLIVSGGHTQLVYSKKLGHYQIIGETQDDAAGEAFDKVAKLIGLGYPGGPEISKRAEKGNPKRFDLPRPMINSKNYDFSFSGLKTAVLYLVKGLYSHSDKKPLKLTDKNIADLCASFEQAAVDVLVTKTILATKILKPKTLILGGGVAANKKLRAELKRGVTSQLANCKLILPDPKLTSDNALMIALAAWAEIKLLAPLKNLYGEPGRTMADLKAEPNLRLDQ
jgi:N6-L-threonylcarbamoyladenine synthase